MATGTVQLNFMDLPPEIWLHIFSYVSQHDLYFNVAKTCSCIKAYAMDGSLWHSLNIHDISTNWIEQMYTEPEEMDNYAVLSLLNGLIGNYGLQEKIQSVVFSRYFRYCSLGENEIRYFEKFNNLKELDVGFCDNINTESLKHICGNIRTLTILNIEGCKNVTDLSLGYVGLLEMLSSLNISYCAVLTDSCLVHLHKLMLLQSFCSDGVMNLTDYGIISLLTVHPSLKELVLDGEIMTDKVCEFAAANTNLEVFELSFAENITNCGMKAIAKMNLKKIKLQKLNGISKPSIENIFCRHNSNFRNNFTSIMITDLDTLDDGILTTISKTCHELKQLYIDWCWNVTDVGIDKITKHCGKLSTLSLVGLFSLHGEWLKFLHVRLPYLKLLDASNCNNIDDNELILLARRMPLTEVYTYYHEKVMPNTKSLFSTGIRTESGDDSDNEIKCAGELGVTVDF